MLGRAWEDKDDGEGLLWEPTPQHTIWVNRVPKHKTVKQRVHLDIYARDLAGLEALGAIVARAATRHAHVDGLTDPEGGEFCAFLRSELPGERLHGLVDSAGPETQARWWAGVYGVSVTANDGSYTLEGVPGMPIFTMDFVPVPEVKAVKNRLHLDVRIGAGDVESAVADLVTRGAKVLHRGQQGAHAWVTLADPEGNEFCMSQSARPRE